MPGCTGQDVLVDSSRSNRLQGNHHDSEEGFDKVNSALGLDLDDTKSADSLRHYRWSRLPRS